MIDHEAVRAAHDAPTIPYRRDFLRKSLLLALPVMAMAVPAAAAISMSSPLPASSLAPSYNPLARARGSAEHNVRNYGAVGNGSHDDTSAFQNAINSLPSDGGTVWVPAGTYQIDAVRSVRLRSRMHLQMHPDAKLVARANSADQSAVVLLDRLYDVEISGGQVVGERDSHQGTSGEGGHGVHLRGCVRVTVRDIRISKCWGDGIDVGPLSVWKAPLVVSRDVAVVGIVSTGNRRNAMSITNAFNVDVWDSEFSDTYGTSPQCGICIEPSDDPHGSNATCDNVHIENCIIARNARSGLNIWRRAQGVTAKNCVMEDNASCGVLAESVENVALTGNTIRRNGSTGAAIRKENRNWQVSGNTFYNNYAMQGANPRQPFSMAGTAPRVQKDIRVSTVGSAGMNIGVNHYR